MAQNSTWESTTPAQISVSKAEVIPVCTKYSLTSTTKPKSKKSKTKLKEEPPCTESGAILDQLIRFIGYKFDKHRCGNTASTQKHTEMLYCSMLSTHSHCLQSHEENQRSPNMEMMPQIIAVEAAIEELCAVNHSLARSCMFKRLKYVSRCIKSEVDSILQLQNKKWTYGALDVCRHLEVKIMCMWEELQPCEGETGSLMAGLIGVSLRPEVCPFSRAAGTLPCAIWYFEAIFFVAMCRIFLSRA